MASAVAGPPNPMNFATRPLQFALDFSHHAWARGDPAAPARTLAVAQAADQAGIDAIWVSEDPEGWDAFALLGALATVTERAQLGTSVTSPWPRHPNLLAASVATLDQLSGGRAVLGLGRGQVEWHRDALGVDIGPGGPLAALRETITLLRHWWEPPHRASSPPGAPFRIRDWERSIAPLHQPPVYLAAAGPHTLALAGELADGVIFNVLTSEHALAAAIPLARDAAQTAGRHPAALQFVLRTEITLSDDPAGIARALQRAKSVFALLAPLPGMARLFTAPGFDMAAILTDVGRAMHTAEVLAEGGGFPALRRAADLSTARAAIPDALISRLALVGPADSLASRLQALQRLGVTCISVAPPPDATSMTAWQRQLEQLRSLPQAS